MALVQQTGNQFGNVTSAALTFPSTTVTGNALFAHVTTYGGNAAGPHANAITDNKGNTWTRGASIGPLGSNADAIYYCLNATGGATHTVTFDPSDHGAQYVTMRIIEYAGLTTDAGSIVANTATATTGNWTVNLVTTVANCLLIGGASHNSASNTNRTYAVGSGYTQTHNFGNGGTAPPLLAQYREVGAAGTYAFDGTISTSSPAWMVVALAVPLAPTSAEYDRTVPGTAALSRVNTRSAPGTAALSRVNSRAVPGTAALGAALARNIPGTAALSRVNQRTVLGTAALLRAGLARTVPGTASLGDPASLLALDTFTAANDTEVTDRQSDSGHDWVMQTGSFDTTPYIITSNRARSQVGGTNIGLLDYTPPTDYEIVAKLYRYNDSGWSIWGRASSTTGSGYALFWNGSRFDLYRYVSGSGTLIGNSEEHASGYSLSNGVLYWVKVRYRIVAGDVEITAWIRADGDGEDNYDLMLDVTDSNAARHTAAGLAGLNMRNTGATSGHHTDEFRVQAVGASDAATLQTEHSRTVPGTAALSSTNARTAPGTAALSAVGTSSAPGTAALSLAGNTRTAPGTAALSAVGARSIPATAALSLAGNARTVPGTVALSASLARAIPGTAALSGVGSRSVPGTASLSAAGSGERAVPGTAALSLAGITRSVPGSAALSRIFARTAPGSAALSRVGARSVPGTAALTSGTIRLVPGTAALQAVAARTVPGTAALSALGSRSVPGTASLGGGGSRAVPGTAALSAIGERSVPGTAALQGVGSRSVPGTASLGGAILVGRARARIVGGYTVRVIGGAAVGDGE